MKIPRILVHVFMATADKNATNRSKTYCARVRLTIAGVQKSIKDRRG